MVLSPQKSVVKEKKSLRIAVISDTAPPQSEGGIGSAHYNLFRALRKKGFNAELFVFFHRGANQAGSAAGELEEFIHRHGPPRRTHKVMLTLNKWLFTVLSPGKIAWNSVDIFASGLGVRRMNLDLKKFDADMLIIPDHGAPGLWLSHRKDAALHLVAHHNPQRLSEPELGNYSRLDATIAVWLEQKVLLKVRKVVCPSRHMKEWFDKTYKFGGEVQVIPNIINKQEVQAINTIDLRPKMSLPQDAVVVGIPSAQTAVKGSQLLPEIIVGIANQTSEEIGFFLPGEVDRDLEKVLSQLPKNIRIHLPGRLSHNEYLAAFKSCSFGIFPSLRDNYSMALIEAVVCGIPMVAFDAGGNADIIKDRENGFLIPNLDAQALIDASVRLVLEPDTLGDLARKTKQYSESHFDGDQTVEQYIDFLVTGT